MQTYLADENDLLLENDGSQVSADRMRWLTIPIYTGLFMLGVMMLIKVRNNFVGIALAYINIWLFMLTILFFVKKQRIECLIPILALPNQMVGWPVTTVYFAIYHPTAYYATWEGTMINNMVDGATRVQLVTLLFWIGYAPIVILTNRAASRVQPIRRPAFAVGCIALLGIVILIINGISKIATFPEPMVYVLDGLLKYLNGIFIIVGALYTQLSKKMKIALIIFFPAIVLFYTLGNARGLAIKPIAFFIAGLLLLSRVSPKIKFAVFISIMILLPIYVVIGNVTRKLSGGVGFTDLAYRWELLKQWRTVTSETPALSSTMGRLFYTGGHALITQTPESHNFLNFSLFGYLRELLLRLLPGKVWFHPYYSHYFILRDYGFRITEETSVEVSMFGNFWILGGFKAVFLGGIAVGMFHSCFMKLIRKAAQRSQLKALIYIGALATMVQATTARAFIDMCRDYIWALFFGFLIWMIICLITGEFSSDSSAQDKYAGVSDEGINK